MWLVNTKRMRSFWHLSTSIFLAVSRNMWGMPRIVCCLSEARQQIQSSLYHTGIFTWPLHLLLPFYPLPPPLKIHPQYWDTNTHKNNINMNTFEKASQFFSIPSLSIIKVDLKWLQKFSIHIYNNVVWGRRWRGIENSSRSRNMFKYIVFSQDCR